MKIKTFTLVALMAVVACGNARAWDWKKGIEDLNIKSIVNSVVSKDKVEVEDLKGTWHSTGPAINFKSENLLQKAGGAAAEAAIEEKLEKYYAKSGMDKISFTFDGTENFTMTLKNGHTVKGTVTKGTQDGTMVFNFSKINSSKLGKVTAYVSKGTQLSVTFDITKLSTLVAGLAKYSNSKAIGSASSLLNSYKGIYAGFKFEQQK